VKLARATLLLVAAPSLMVLAAQSPGASPVEVHLATLANRDAGTLEPCEVVLAAGGSPSLSWSTLGGAGPSDKAGFELRNAAARCGTGAFSAASPAPAGTAAAPVFTQEISVVAGWDPGAMDPGPAGAVQVSLTLTSRQLSGFSPDGKPVYSDPVIDRRSIRLEAGEEYFVPVPAAEAPGPGAPGVREVLLRIRAGWAGRAGSTEYGAIAIMAAAPGSEILLDGGDAGRAAADGSLLLASVPVGQREVRLRGASGPVVSRWALVAKGRTAAVSPEPLGAGASLHPFLTPAGKNSQGFPEYRRLRDEATMVQIPEGEFLMGNLETEGSPLPHNVYVSSFLMDKLPVTVARFKRFAAATGRPLPPDPYWGVHDNFPVAFVRWDESKAYCEWAGGRLPTEAEREKAARGTDGRLWPWGNDPAPTTDHGVFRRNWGEEGNDAVGIRPAGASPYGLLDTGGNMWEWVEDWYDPDYFRSSPQKDPAGPRTGRARVVKGGSWDSRPTVLSASSRNFGYIGYREGDYGFRCAADPPR
jgi:formylglycine-generating enzyme required for sulfatase activity